MNHILIVGSVKENFAEKLKNNVYGLGDMVKSGNIEEINRIFKKYGIDAVASIDYRGTTRRAFRQYTTYENFENQVKKSRGILRKIDFLFCAMRYGNFEIVKELLEKASLRLDSLNMDKENIYQSLILDDRIDIRKFLFIQKIVKDSRLIVGDMIFFLIDSGDYALVEAMLKYKYFDLTFIKNLLFYSKYQTPISKENFKSLVYENNKGLVRVNSSADSGDFSVIRLIDSGDVIGADLFFKYHDNIIFNKNFITIDFNERDAEGRYPLLWAVYRGNYKMTKMLMEHARENNVVLEMNERGYQGLDTLSWAVVSNYPELVQLLMDYADENNIILNINGKNENDGNYPLLIAVIKNNSDVVETLINYANRKNITLTINDKNKKGVYPLLKARRKDNIGIIKQLLNYGLEKNIILDIDYNNPNTGEYLFKTEIIEERIETVECILEYAQKINYNIGINKRDKYGICPLYEAINSNSLKMVKVLIKHSIKNNINLDINEKYEFKNDYTPLLLAIKKKNIGMVKLIIDYAEKNNIILDVNAKSKDGYYPVLVALSSKFNEKTNHNIGILRMLIRYAKKHNILLNILDKNYVDGGFPILEATFYNNFEAINFLIDYAEENDILLNINDTNNKKSNPFKISYLNKNALIIEYFEQYISKNNMAPVLKKRRLLAIK